ncbi:putative deferrochelatase/peroxidase YfeX [Marinobacterium sp. xm-d-579]|uniref:Dyp-type peroxidase n=1 Tax=Marinobacterium sp. xm-d-579 TaxID=2497734 RepID=UPI001569E2AE|nr:Dyp-type peroxidase [Marinobacterium sp. xm-d-579]NRP36394.1 putative deferrochelatase/peroxidase YfeX [Marinobacterium sp. xm-d-579]
MSIPQPGIIAESSQHAIYLSYNVKRNSEALSSVKAFLKNVPVIQSRLDSLGNGAFLTVAVGSVYWHQISTTQPAELTAFPALENGIRVAPSTPTDLYVSIRSDSVDINMDLMAEVQNTLGSNVTLIEEIRGFRYHDMRDLTGFVDGTENPEGDHRAEVALVGEGEFAGGSYLHVQRYEHDLESWGSLPVSEQEKTYGRTKQDNVEFASADKSPHAHTKRTSLKDENGQSIEILRHSMPYGDAHRKGLVFISFGASPVPFTKMLTSMVMGDEHGDADNLLLFTRAVTGSAYFAPSINWLEQL